MKKHTIFLFGVVFCFVVPQAVAQLSLSGEFRPRAEANHGVFSLADKGQDVIVFIEQRTRLNVDYQAKKFKTKLVLQDVRTWGSTPQLAKSDNFSALHEAWAELFFNENISLKLGRQELSYDDERILGSVGWAQQARSHDLAVFKLTGKLNLHVGIAHNTSSTSPTNPVYALNPGYKNMQFIWINHQQTHFKLSFLLLNNGIQQVNGPGEVRINYSQTLGPRLVYEGEKLGGQLAFYYQTGKNAQGNDLAAHDLMAELTYKPSGSSTLILGYERLSGTDQLSPTDDKNRSFFPLYGTNHKFNGLMDYFYVGNHANNVGLQDFYAKFRLKGKQHMGGLDLHYFATAADLGDPANPQQAMSNGLGTEVDLYWSYTIDQHLSLSAGYSQMFGTASMEVLKGGNKEAASYWSWVMLTVKPVFFTDKSGQQAGK
ncbi:MAG: hypothetical protein D6730_01145 [Bacteroidetes bacterium]|nr:MAG: hypothetical protein D6730_01145 [Bacteroidota bacterium]